MTRENLDDVPRFDVPTGFSIRPYQPGDERHWWEIHERADATLLVHRNGSFRQFFGANEEALRSRQRFLVAPDGQVIGTATAWLDSAALGRVHWVAIVPEYQGRGLSKPLLSQILLRLRELGHSRATLDTSSQRPRAIALYRQFGFVAD